MHSKRSFGRPPSLGSPHLLLADAKCMVWVPVEVLYSFMKRHLGAWILRKLMRGHLGGSAGNASEIEVRSPQHARWNPPGSETWSSQILIWIMKFMESVDSMDPEFHGSHAIPPAEREVRTYSPSIWRGLFQRYRSPADAIGWHPESDLECRPLVAIHLASGQMPSVW